MNATPILAADSLNAEISNSQKIDYYAVLGNPVAHSKSPTIHAMFAAQTGQRLQYGKHELSLDHFANALVQLRSGKELPSGAQLLGCNVTVPFKLDALRLADLASDRAQLAQASNTLVFTSQGVMADNTDGAGLVADITQHAGYLLQGKRILVIGAGGAAAGILAPLLMQQPASLWLCNRTASKAMVLADRHQAVAQTQAVDVRAASFDQVNALPNGSFDVIINASSSSLSGAALPLRAMLLAQASAAQPTLAYDLMYGKAVQPFFEWIQTGQTAQSLSHVLLRDGLGMLVEQAALSFQLWRGVMPDTVPVLKKLRGDL